MQHTATRPPDHLIMPRGHQEQLFARFVAENPNPVMIAGAHGVIVWANTAARDLYAGPLEDILPADHTDLVTTCRTESGKWRSAKTTIGQRIYSFSYLCSQSTSLVHIYGQDVTEKVHLAHQERRIAELHQSLIDIGVWLTENLDAGLVIEKTLIKARELLDCEMAGLAVLQDGELLEMHHCRTGVAHIVTAIGDPGQVSFLRSLAMGQQTLRFDDACALTLQSSVCGLLDGETSFLGTPLRYGDGILGVLYAAGRHGAIFTELDEQVLEMLAMQAASAMNNARLYAEIRNFNLELEGKIQARTQELSEALRLAEAANATKSTFLASMSHELRTPLNAVIGFAEVLQDRFFGPLTDKQAEYVTDILESGQHLLSLINDILDISKVEAGQISLEPRRIHLPGFVESTLVFVREKAAKHGIELVTEVDQDVPDIWADERRIKQVIFNLLSNAVKFTPDGGKVTLRCARVAPADLPPQVTTTLAAAAPDALGAGSFEDPLMAKDPDGMLVALSVADTGIGIAPEHQSRVFEQFYQVKGDLTGKTPGTGLGLTITRQIVQLHGGAIWLSSKGDGHGCVFTFVVPALAADQRVVPEGAAA